MAQRGADAPQDEEHRLRVAVAALLTEMVRMDEEITEAERAQVLASIAEKFELDAKEAAELMALAEEEAQPPRISISSPPRSTLPSAPRRR
ncbi:MAG: TerB family tellurite resistance protein [Gammaproteobacteria bacterium]